MNDEETTFYRHVIEKAEKRRKAGRARLTVRVLLLVLATTALLSVGLAVIAIARNGMPVPVNPGPNDGPNDFLSPFDLIKMNILRLFVEQSALVIKVLIFISTPIMVIVEGLTVRRLVLWLKPFFHV